MVGSGSSKITNLLVVRGTAADPSKSLAALLFPSNGTKAGRIFETLFREMTARPPGIDTCDIFYEPFRPADLMYTKATHHDPTRLKHQA
eukprot:m.380632 g.380632  ORF g.380632 m.380632 type:complete len:89 (-) comp20959_c0_seq1:135-401(-)